jgi:hypothetical protein
MGAEAMQNEIQIQIKDLPDSFTEPVFQAVKCYAVGLGIEIPPPPGQTENDVCEIIGSGTLISWNQHFGILTAEHVTSFPPDPRLRLDTSWTSNQRLRLLLDDRVSTFGFEARALRIHTLGKSVERGFGPDLAVIQLPLVSELATLQAKRSFWSLTHESSAKLAKALDPLGCMVIAGHPGEDQTNVGSRGGFQEVTLAPGLVGFTGQQAYLEHGGFDYIEVASLRDATNQAPNSYAGISGGSLWRIPIMRKPKDNNSQVYPGPLTLAGVPNYEFIEGPGKVRVRAHGPKSIYECLLTKLISDAP